MPNLTLAELGQLGRWKSPRIGPRLAANDEAYVEAVTAVALTTPSEPLRIEVLTLLSGVGWPMASVGLGPLPFYDFPLWCDYTGYCRRLADVAGVSMRDLDRALWQFSKENQ